MRLWLPNDSCFSLYQAAFGRQPRLIGDTLGSIESRLAERSPIDGRTSHARLDCFALQQLGLRRAELARSRSTMEQVPTPGTICYFHRPSRFNNYYRTGQPHMLTTSPDTGADNWWLVGDNGLVAIGWWQCVGGNWQQVPRLPCKSHRQGCGDPATSGGTSDPLESSRHIQRGPL